MQKRWGYLLLVLLTAIASSSQETAKLRIKAAVVTNDLNVKAVPKLELSVEPEAVADSFEHGFRGSCSH